MKRITQSQIANLLDKQTSEIKSVSGIQKQINNRDSKFLIIKDFENNKIFLAIEYLFFEAKWQVVSKDVNNKLFKSFKDFLNFNNYLIG